MRKFTFIALTALCFALLGTTKASSTGFQNSQEELLENSEISPQRAEEILKYVSFKYGFDLICICEDYAKGEIAISKSPSGYEVELTLQGGNVAIISIIEDII